MSQTGTSETNAQSNLSQEAMESAMGTFDFSNLMQLASLDTSELEAQLTRLSLPGLYVIDIGKIMFSTQAPSDPAKPMNFNLAIPGTILAFVPLNKEDEPKAAEMVGKALNERYFLYGENLKEAVQLLMGRFKIVGFRHKGIMGGVEGSQAGWINEAEGRRVVVRVSHYTDKGDQQRARFDWLSPRAMKKANIDWEIMGRDFLDEKGNVIEVPYGDDKKAA